MQGKAQGSGRDTGWHRARPGFARRLFRVLPVCLLLLDSASLAAAAETLTGIPVRGVVRSLNQSTLSTNIRAKVLAVTYREGEHFLAGEALVTFDCRAEEARLTAARALSKEKQVNVNGTRYLLDLKAGSTQDVEIAQAQFERAQAEVEVIAANLEGCVLKAPFNGVVRELHIQQNERPNDGAPIISIIDIHNSVIELIVSSNWIKDIVPGRRFAFKIDETGETRAAIIERTAPVVDPVSQTIRVYARFEEEDINVLPGMSGEATFNLDWQLR